MKNVWQTYEETNDMEDSLNDILWKIWYTVIINVCFVIECFLRNLFLGLYQFKSFLNFWKSYFNWVMINKIEPRCTWMLILKTYICFNSTSNNCVIVGRGNIATTKIEALFMACNFIFSQAPDHHNLWCER